MPPLKIFSIGLDLGTTAIKAGLLDESGHLCTVFSQPAPAVSRRDGRYESDAQAYAEAAEHALAACRAEARNAALGLCSQRSSFVIWNRASGQPVTPLISWQDNRGAASSDALRHEEGILQNLTGLRLAPYYLAPKLRVVLGEHPEWHAGLEQGELAVGTLDTFLIWRWTGGKRFITDASMAARTLLMDLCDQRWSPALCALFGVPLTALPGIAPSLEVNLQMDNGLILQATMGDQSAALMASVGSIHSDVLVNLGTGGFAMRYLREQEAVQPGYLRTLVYQDSGHHGHVAMEGTLNSLAAALAPYPVGECGVEDLGLNEIFCLAEPSGLGAPYFRADLGMCFSASVSALSPREIGCLLLEGIIFRVARMLEDFQRGSAIGRVLLAGGLSGLAALRQGIALCAPCAVFRLEQENASLLGAALAAAGMGDLPVTGTEIVQVDRRNPALIEKYGRWKEWFDRMLRATAPDQISPKVGGV